MDRLICIPLGALLGSMLVFPGQAADAALSAMRLWAAQVVPVLAPFLFCARAIAALLCPPYAVKVLLCFCCGSPGGARLMQEPGLSQREALHRAALTGTVSPMFLIGTVGAWLGDGKAGALLFFCHIMGAVLTGCVFRGDGTRAPTGNAARPSPTALFKEVALAMPPICLCMMLGSVSVRMVFCALPCLPSAYGVAMQCALEMTSGVRALITLGAQPLFPLLCAACSFGGLSILLQNASIWRESGIGIRRLLPPRLCHAALSAALGALIALLM